MMIDDECHKTYELIAFKVFQKEVVRFPGLKTPCKSLRNIMSKRFRALP